MALVGVELEMLLNEQDALTTRPPPCAMHIRRNLRCRKCSSSDKTQSKCNLLPLCKAA